MSLSCLQKGWFAIINVKITLKYSQGHTRIFELTKQLRESSSNSVSASGDKTNVCFRQQFQKQVNFVLCSEWTRVMQKELLHNEYMVQQFMGIYIVLCSVPWPATAFMWKDVHWHYNQNFDGALLCYSVLCTAVFKVILDTETHLYMPLKTVQLYIITKLIQHTHTHTHTYMIKVI